MKIRARYNLALRIAAWILKGVQLFLLVFIPLHLVLLSFQIALPTAWVLPFLGRTLLLALAAFFVGGFWSSTRH